MRRNTQGLYQQLLWVFL